MIRHAGATSPSAPWVLCVLLLAIRFLKPEGPSLINPVRTDSTPSLTSVFPPRPPPIFHSKCSILHFLVAVGTRPYTRDDLPCRGHIPFHSLRCLRSSVTNPNSSARRAFTHQPRAIALGTQPRKQKFALKGQHPFGGSGPESRTSGQKVENGGTRRKDQE
jgi:hypothetical protein